MPKVGVFAAVFDESDRILCVKINYGSGNWTLPGGHLENNESPCDGVKREVLEETGYIVDIENLISVYSAPEKDDIVFVFKAKIKGQIEWKPNDEIQKIDFFEKNALPTQIHPWNIKRINDVYENKISNLWVFE
jgi:8-oxo-dGTP diphosphatase